METMRRIYTVETVDCEINEKGELLSETVMPDFDVECYSSLLEATKAFKTACDDIEEVENTNIKIEMNGYDILLPENSDFQLNYDEFRKQYTDFYSNATPIRYGSCRYFKDEEDENTFECEFENYILEEEVRYKSEFFSMRKVCEKAGINYSTFRGFKNNKQYFSREKLLKLLDTMKAISGESWNDEIKAAVGSL